MTSVPPRTTGRRIAAATIAVLAAASTAGLATARTQATAATEPAITVIARHLHQPKKLTVTAGGDVIVALSGTGAAPSSCTDATEASCEGHSGAIDEITPRGRVRTLLSGLTSISSGGTDAQATGPVMARLSGGHLDVLYQDLDLDSSTGITSFGTSSRLGDLVSVAGLRARVLAAFGPYEAKYEPDRDQLGSAVAYGYEGAINSDPYGFVAYRGGWAVADAGANDVLWVSPRGRISVLAVLPTIREHAAAKTFGSSQTHAIEAEAQSVPTAVAVGPDGALYVGELGGLPSDRGTSDVYRIVPGHRMTVYARGLTAIADMTFDHSGRLLVLELDQKGLADSGFQTGHPASGEIVAVSRTGAKRVLVASGLPYATGIAAGPAGSAYVAIDGVSDDGELVRVNL